MSIAKVIVRSTAVRARKVGDYRFEVQDAILQKSPDESAKIELRVGDDGKPHPEGEYTIGGESFSVNDYGSVTINKRGIVLVPIKSAQPARVAG